MQEEKIFRLPIIRYFRNRYIKKYENFMKSNRPEVLLMYRKFLKIIPTLYTRKMIIQSKLEVKKEILYLKQIERSANSFSEKQRMKPF